MPDSVTELFREWPPVPHDKDELARIERLLEKIPIYEQKVEELALKIKALAFTAVEKGAHSNFYEIEMMIFRAFFIELENRPYERTNLNDLIKLHANLIHEGIIKNRNISCEVCGENRSIDKCHIIPSKLGGTYAHENVLYLCPTHHRLFDRLMLSQEEWHRIDWMKKSAEARAYAKRVILTAQKKFWRLLEKQRYSRIPTYETDRFEPFIADIIRALIHLIPRDGNINRKNLVRSLSPDVQELGKRIIKALLSENIIAVVRQGTQQLISCKVVPEQVQLAEIVKKVYSRL